MKLSNIPNEALIRGIAFNLCDPATDLLKNMKKIVLNVKREYLIEDTKKKNTEMRKRGLSSSRDFQDIYSVFESKDPEVIETLCDNIAILFANDYFRIIDDPESKHAEIDLLLSDWSLLGEYLKRKRSLEHSKALMREFSEDILFSKKYSDLNIPKHIMEKFKRDCTHTIEKLYEDRPAFDISDLRDNKTIIREYRNDFLDKNMETLIHIMLSVPYTTSYCNSAQSHVAGSLSLGMIERDNEMIDGTVTMMNERRASAMLGIKPCIPPTEEEYLMFLINTSFSKVIFEYVTSGLDISAIIRSADIKHNEMKDIIRNGFIIYEIKNGKCSYASDSRKRGVFETIIRLMAAYAISRKTEEFYKATKERSESKDMKTARKMIKTLTEEKECLLKKLEKPVTVKKNDNKELYAEIARLKKELRSRDEENALLKNEIEDVKAVVREIEESEPEEDVNYEEEFREYIRNHKVLVWGMRDNTNRRYLEMFPEIRTMSSDMRLDSNQIRGYDVILIGTGYTNHGSFWITRDLIKNAGIPFAYLKKNDYSPKNLANAWAIATNRRTNEKK